MRKLSRFAALLLVIALLGTCAFATDNGSPSQTGDQVVDETPEANKPAGATLEKTEDASKLPEKEAAALEAAKDETKDVAKFVNDNEAIKAAADKAGVAPEDLERADLFDLSYIDDAGNVVEPTGPVTAKVKVSGKAVIVAHNLATGEWEVLDFKQEGDYVTFTVDSLSPILILTEKTAAPSNPSDKPAAQKPGKVTSPQTGETASHAVLALATLLLASAAVCTVYAKRYAR